MAQELNLQLEEGEILSSGNPKLIRNALQIAWPSILESFFTAFATMVDSYMVSSMGPYAVAAVGLTNQPRLIALAFFMALNAAVSTLVARRKGQKDRYGANQILVLALLVVGVMVALISSASFIFANQILRFVGTAPDTHGPAVLYFRIILVGMVFNVFFLCINAAQRGSGNTKIAMRSNVTANTVNIIGNYLLIGGHFGFPALGIRGAALATIFGQFVALCMSTASILSEKSFVSLPFILKQRVRPGRAPVHSLVKIGSATFAEQILNRIGMLMVAMLAANLGTAAFAAHQVGNNVMSLSFSFGDGLQVAAVTLVGQSLGLKNPDLAKAYGQICRRVGLIISIILSVIFLLFGKLYYTVFFPSNPEIVEFGILIMRMMCIVTLFQIGQVVYTGCLRGAGDVFFATVTSLITITIIRPACCYLFCYAMNLNLLGMWMGIAVSQLSRLVLVSRRFKSGKWTAIHI